MRRPAVPIAATSRAITAGFLLAVLLNPIADAVNLDTDAAGGPGAEDFAAGMAAVEAGDLATAVDRLEGAVRAEPENLRYGAEYRQAVIATREYDRALALFEELAKANPGSAAVHLNWGYAYVDKIPDAGAVTQVILANTALQRFSDSLDIEETWLGLYTRGNSYVYWPVVFGRAQLGIADLEKAISWSREMGDEAPAYHSHAYAAIGDAHWRLGDKEAARSWWEQGAERFPGSERIQARAGRDDEAVEELLKAHYAIGERVHTDLRELWEKE